MKNCYNHIFIILLIVISCKPSQKTSSPIQDPHENLSGSAILFLAVKMQEEDGEFQLDLSTVKWVDGQLREKQNEFIPKPHLLLDFLDENESSLKKMTVTNPLYRSVEQFSPDGTISRKELKLKKATLVLRTQLSRQTTYLSISTDKGEFIAKLKLR